MAKLLLNTQDVRHQRGLAARRTQRGSRGFELIVPLWPDEFARPKGKYFEKKADENSWKHADAYCAIVASPNPNETYKVDDHVYRIIACD